MSIIEPVRSDKELKALFFSRQEEALELCSGKYGKLFYKIALNITHSHETSEEIVNDTYLKLWNSIPPADPESVSAYGAKTARNLALNRVRNEEAKHRPQIVCELDEALPANFETEIPSEDLGELISTFLEKIRTADRLIFIDRYFNENTSDEIALRFALSASGVRASLKRTRKKLRAFLESRGYQL